MLPIVSDLFGKMYADKGYIGKEFAQKMKDKGVEIITRVRKNMKEVEHSDVDRALLRKRSLVETVFDELKNLCQIEHTRHRSLMNFAVNLMAGIVAYLPASRQTTHQGTRLPRRNERDLIRFFIQN
ncbi:MAG: transposase [Polaromonas sp.]|nr:transposase [Polaromonas sp.]